MAGGVLLRVDGHGMKDKWKCNGESRIVGCMRVLAAFLIFGAVAASAQKMDVKTIGTSGHPTEAVATPDGQYVLVTVETGGGGSGIEVLHDDGGKLKKVAFQSLGGGNAQGILLIPHTQML